MGGFRLKQAHADQPPTVIDAIDREPVHLELADDRGREVDPGGVQLGEGDRLIPGLAQSREHSLLLGVLPLALEAQLVPAGDIVDLDRLVLDDVSVIAYSLIGHSEQRQ